MLRIPCLFFILSPSLALAVDVPPTGRCQDIQNAIEALPADGGEVVLSRGQYQCEAPIVIDRDNVVLRGNGTATILRLADRAEAPVIVIGETATPPQRVVRAVRVADLLIDGNKDGQMFECYRGPCETNPLRNNGITVRHASDILVERVTVVRARSGGLVTELGCVRITVREFTSTINYFDGLAAYETEDSIFTGLRLIDNGAAGLSFDLRFNNNMITETVIAGSRSVGIFMRDATNNLFNALQVRSSGEHGVFLAQVDSDASKPAARNTFAGLVVSGSAGAGVRVSDLSCVDNVFSGGLLLANAAGCVSEPTPGLAQTSGLLCR